MAATVRPAQLQRFTEEVTCPICLDVAQLPVNFVCFRGCGGKFSVGNTCLRSVLCIHCANEALQLGRTPAGRFPDSSGFTHCLICRETRVDSRSLTPENAYGLNHNVAAIMDALGIAATCRFCDQPFDSQSTLHQHYLRKCPAAIVRCRFRGCAHWHRRRDAAAHEDSCSVGRAQCGQCGAWVDRSDMLRHMVSTCRLRVVNCMLCSYSALLPDMLEHLRLHQSRLQGQVGAGAMAARQQQQQLQLQQQLQSQSQQQQQRQVQSVGGSAGQKTAPLAPGQSSSMATGGVMAGMAAGTGLTARAAMPAAAAGQAADGAGRGSGAAAGLPNGALSSGGAVPPPPGVGCRPPLSAVAVAPSGSAVGLTADAVTGSGTGAALDSAAAGPLPVISSVATGARPMEERMQPQPQQQQAAGDLRSQRVSQQGMAPVGVAAPVTLGGAVAAALPQHGATGGQGAPLPLQQQQQQRQQQRSSEQAVEQQAGVATGLAGGAQSQPAPLTPQEVQQQAQELLQLLLRRQQQQLQTRLQRQEAGPQVPGPMRAGDPQLGRSPGYAGPDPHPRAQQSVSATPAGQPAAEPRRTPSAPPLTGTTSTGGGGGGGGGGGMPGPVAAATAVQLMRESALSGDSWEGRFTGRPPMAVGQAGSRTGTVSLSETNVMFAPADDQPPYADEMTMVFTTAAAAAAAAAAALRSSSADVPQRRPPQTGAQGSSSDTGIGTRPEGGSAGGDGAGRSLYGRRDGRTEAPNGEGHAGTYLDLIRRRGEFWTADLDAAPTSNGIRHVGNVSGAGGDYHPPGQDQHQHHGVGAGVPMNTSQEADEAARLVRTAAAIVRASANASVRRSFGNRGHFGPYGSIGGTQAPQSGSTQSAANLTGSPGIAANPEERPGAGVAAGGSSPGAPDEAGGQRRAQAAPGGSPGCMRRSFSDTELVFDVLEELVRASSNARPGERSAARVTASGM